MEKERYTIEQFELDEPNCIFDNETQNVIFILSKYYYDELSSLINLLNKQDVKIKSETAEKEFWHSAYKEKELSNDLLLKENQQLKEDLQAKDILVNTYMSIVGTLDNAKQLKQSQNEKAIEVLEKVKAILVELGQNYDLNFCGIKVYNFVDNKIEELRSEK